MILLEWPWRDPSRVLNFFSPSPATGCSAFWEMVSLGKAPFGRHWPSVLTTIWIISWPSSTSTAWATVASCPLKTASRSIRSAAKPLGNYPSCLMSPLPAPYPLHLVTWPPPWLIGGTLTWWMVVMLRRFVKCSGKQLKWRTSPLLSLPRPSRAGAFQVNKCFFSAWGY